MSPYVVLYCQDVGCTLFYTIAISSSPTQRTSCYSRQTRCGRSMRGYNLAGLELAVYIVSDLALNIQYSALTSMKYDITIE